MIQTLTDAINLILIDKGLSQYINEFTLKMLPPTTQEDSDRRESLYNKVQLSSDIMNLIGDQIEDPTVKLKVLKNLLSGYITDPDILALIQEEIDKLENGQEEETPSEEGDVDEFDDFGSDLGGSGDFGSIDLDAELGLGGSEEGGGEEFGGDFGEESAPAEAPRTALPTPAELGADFTDSNAPEFQ